MNASWHIAIVIPARDEEELLPRCLRSVQNARRMLPPYVTTDLIVVADQSTDGTFDIARELIQNNGTVVRPKWAAWAPLGLSERGVHWNDIHGAPNRCWLANTDAMPGARDVVT